MEKENETKLVTNLSLYLSKLEKYGVSSESLEKLIERLGGEEKLKVASFGLNKDSNCAYEGSFISNIFKITAYAQRICTVIPAYNENKEIVPFKTTLESLIKVCLLHQIAKVIMLEPNDNEWEVNNRGILYKYAELNGTLKCGERSLLLCTECGISFTEEEYEAMLCLDKRNIDDQLKYYASPISIYVMQANELNSLKNRLIK